MRTTPIRLLLLLLLVIGGCSVYRLVATERVTVCDLYSVKPGVHWSEVGRGDVRLWTVDGPDLQSIRFISDIREGVPIIDITERQRETPFRPDMSEFELVEAIVDGFSLSGAQRVEVKSLRPTPFGKLEGFRFELGFLNADGLEKEGVIVGTIFDQSLYLIIYTGARIHYFPKYAGEFENIVQSIQIEADL